VLGEQPVLRGIDFAVGRGTRLALVGPNGAGKSTVLRVTAGLTRPASGEVLIEGRSLVDDPWHARRAIGLVGHYAMLHPDLTARENLTVFGHLYGLDRVEERAEAGLRQFGLERRGDTRVTTLSRGMLQRLALARALLHEPAVLLLDEAETGLDVRAHEWLIAALGERGSGRTVIFASHDVGFVREVADEVVFLRAGRVAGRVQTAGLGPDELRSRYSDALAARSAANRSAYGADRVVGVAGQAEP
jgi:ABC-type multidrug transport system ATPase subunit